jgi:N6-L-threonylcarbamoyladenine synthase
MIVLGLESTCDETACAIVKDGKEILANVVYSQIDVHTRYGGVFPELACRRHIDALIPVIQAALDQAGLTSNAIDLIAVSKGPGLIGALLIGLNAAKALSFAWNIPYIGINHVEAHLYAAMMLQEELFFPALGLVVSGGHTFMVKIDGVGSYQMIGTTLDDAVGEAFDKVAALLGLPYPGGPAVEALAKQGDPTRYPFKAGSVKGKPWDFSFSGLKTNVLYTLKGPNADKHAPLQVPEEDKAHIAASFQETALNDLVTKARLAAQEYGCKAIYVGGGVSQNQRLRDLFSEKEKNLSVYFPTKELSVDNAAMIAGLGYTCFLQRKEGDALDLEPQTRIPL